MDLSASVGPIRLRSPLIGAAGTVASVVDFAGVGATSAYGAMVAKSVSGVAWEGRPPPRLAPAGNGMLNGIGIQNPGIDAWVETYAGRIGDAGVPVWGSAVGETPGEYAMVAAGLERAGVAAIEVNLSCPNLDGGAMFALDAAASSQVVAEVRRATTAPVGAKLSPNAPDIVRIAGAVLEAGADFVTLTNTIWGAALDPVTRRPVLSGTIGGYSGTPLKPIAIRCVIEVRQAFPGAAIVGCGGVRTAEDVVEYLVAGADAVAVGTAHFESPRIGAALIRGLHRFGRRHGVESVSSLVATMEQW